MPKPFIDDVISKWTLDLGFNVGVAGKRLSNFNDLFTTFIHEGFTREEVESVRNKIIKASFNSNSAKWRVWKEMVERDLNAMFAQYYGNVTIQEGSQELMEKIKDAQQTAVDEARSAVEPKEYKRMGEELDRSIFKGLPKTEIEYDEDVIKLLGIKTDE